MPNLKFLDKTNASHVMQAVKDIISEHVSAHIDEQRELVNEARFKRTNRIRKGEIQRRKKVGTNGYRVSGDDVVRMTPQERRKRRRGQVKAARKRRATKARSERKRTISMRKRRRFGESVDETTYSTVQNAIKQFLGPEHAPDADMFRSADGLDIAIDDYEGASDAFNSIVSDLKKKGFVAEYQKDETYGPITHMILIDTNEG